MIILDSKDWIESTGTLIYDPHGRNSKTTHKVSEPWWLLLLCDNGIVSHAGYWLKKKGIRIQTFSLYGSHVSIVKGEVPKCQDAWKKYHKKKVKFKYCNAIHGNGKHWWMFVKCPKFGRIRKELGLPENPPYFRYHLTVGRKDP